MSVQHDIARRVAGHLEAGEVVNLGIGIPTLVADFLDAGSGVVLQTENGMLGVGPAPGEDAADPALVNAGKLPITALPGASYFSSSVSFGLIRGGHVTTSVLGALQIDGRGRIANWALPGRPILGVGGAMDLLVGARRVIAATTHLTKDGEPKLVAGVHPAADRRAPGRPRRHRGGDVRAPRRRPRPRRDRARIRRRLDRRAHRRPLRPRPHMREAVIAGALRTPLGRHGGQLAGVRPDDLAAHVLRHLVAAHGLDPADVADVYMGCANQAGEDNRDVARMAVLLAGFPESVPGVTVNRLCGSGLEAVAQAARAVMTGDAELAIGAGVESMSRAPYVQPKAERPYATGPVTSYDTTLGWRLVNPRMEALGHTDALGITAETLARGARHRPRRPGCLRPAQPRQGGRRAAQRPAGPRDRRPSRRPAAAGRPSR